MSKPILVLTATTLGLTAMGTGLLLPKLAIAQSSAALPSFRAIVNSNQDGAPQADAGLTLREAILLLNGVLTVEQLSPAERAQVQPLTDGNAKIEFRLPTSQTTIRLEALLPSLNRPGLVLDGTTQPGYAANSPVINELPLAAPIVEITPAAGKEVIRGLTITADNVTVRGLSLYGFTGDLSNPTRTTKYPDLQGWETRQFDPSFRATATTPPADIFIAHRLPPPNISKQRPPANFSPFYSDDLPAQNVVIEDNWLGLPPTLAADAQPITPTVRSAFGVSVFNGSGAIIRRNWIANHNGSGIITSVKANNLLVTENVITGNGVAGMPDAIRLEGDVTQAKITGNLVCGNDGSGVYLFKPQGSIVVENNQIIYNGRRLRRAAVYLMGDRHRVTDNQIRYQTGPGVVVTAAPRSVGNQIQANRFSDLEGLSIDLVQLNQTGIYDYQVGDGPNPPRDSGNRRIDTGNAGVNAPQFVAREFLALGITVGAAAETSLLAAAQQAAPVEVFGTADPGSQVEIYRVVGSDESGYAPLAEPLATVDVTDAGKFKATLTGLRVGDRISAIATHPTDGTSEPARTALIRSVELTSVEIEPPMPSIPRCVTAYAPPQPPAQTPPPQPLSIQVPTRIHFALDKSTISPRTAKVLDQIAAVMLQNPALVVDLAGHTDPRANDAYNLALGRRRALAARNYLLRKGVAPERMTIRSQGERSPLSQGRSRIDYARNRRVEFSFRDARGLKLVVQETDLQIEP